jgi:hypothetical protein
LNYDPACNQLKIETITKIRSSFPRSDLIRDGVLLRAITGQSRMRPPAVEPSGLDRPIAGRDELETVAMAIALLPPAYRRATPESPGAV